MQKSVGYYVGRFTLFHVVTLVTIVALAMAFFTIAPALATRVLAGPGMSGIGVATFIVPPMLVGQVFFRNEQRAMTRGEGWGLALAFTFVVFAIAAAVLFVMAQFDRSLHYVLTDVRDGIMILVGSLALLASIILSICRLTLWSSIRGQIKKAERLARKHS